jgi:hypothetical protein
MVTQLRPRDLIHDGRVLIDALQREHFPVSGAFWVNNGYFRLVIASRLPSEKGPIQTYREFLRILHEMNLRELDSIDVSVLSPTDPNYLSYYESLPYRSGWDPRDLEVHNGYIYFLDPEARPARFEQASRARESQST